MKTKIGKVVFVSTSNTFGWLHILEEGREGNLFFALFNKIKNYHGEYSKELTQFGTKGLRRGQIVKFNHDKNGKVSSVSPLIFI